MTMLLIQITPKSSIAIINATIATPAINKTPIKIHIAAEFPKSGQINIIFQNYSAKIFKIIQQNTTKLFSKNLRYLVQKRAQETKVKTKFHR